MLIRLLQIAILALAGTLLAPPGVTIPVPSNVSSDPDGKVGEVRIDEMEMKPNEIVPTHKVQAADTVDWSVKAMAAERDWANGWTGKGVIVAVLDTGIDSEHRDLATAIDEAKDFTRSRTGSTDVVGHGTHCAGSIAARKNDWGTVGVAPDCRLLIGKVLGDSGSGTTDDIAAGISWAVKKGAKVISMSLGGGGADAQIPVALKEAEEAGVIVIAAAGNDGNGRAVNYPGAYPFCIAISAVDSSLRLASFSCTGAKVEACGPGVNVRSTYPGNRFADLSGTSMACPNVAGKAVLWSQWAEATGVPQKDRPKKFREFLATGKDLGTAGRDTSYGFGLPNAELKKGDVVTPPVPPVPPVPAKPGLALDESDLNEKGLKKLRDAGWEKWKLELGKPADAPTAAPKISRADIEKRVLAGEKLIIAIGVKLDLMKYPKGYELDEAEAREIGFPAPGVYEVFTEPEVKAKRIE